MNVKRLLIAGLLVTGVVMLVACKNRRDEPVQPVCHVVPDPEFGFSVCRYY